MKYGRTKINPGWVAAGAILISAAAVSPISSGGGSGSTHKWNVGDVLLSRPFAGHTWRIIAVYDTAYGVIHTDYNGAHQQVLVFAELETNEFYLSS